MFKIYQWLIIVLGAIAFFKTLLVLDLYALGYSYIIFCLTTVIFASRIVVQIPRIKGHISVSDTFIFLSILIYGGGAGILLASLDAVPAAYRLAKTRTTLAFNVAVFALATFSTVFITRLIFGSLTNLTLGIISSEFIALICILGISQYIFNSGLIAIGVALRMQKPIWQTWKDNFLWTSITYFAGASAAGIIAKLIGMLGIYAFLTAIPIAVVIYFTYTTYLKNVEAATEKAEQAKKHVQELSHHIAEQERISRALKESEEYFRTTFDHAAGMAVIDTDGKWLQVNESLCNMLGYTEEELLQKGFQTITNPEDLGNDLANLYQLLEGKMQNYQLEKRYCQKNGQMIWVLQSASLVRDAEGRSRHVILQIQDISDRKKAEELIHHAAFHDALTGLPNRTLFADRLSMAIERAKRTSSFLFAVIFVDLDRFKIVNDSLGHDMGDKLLVELSQRLLKETRAVDTVSRLGGDEFAILLDGISNINDATEIAERIQTLLQLPFDLDGHEFFTSASMGIAYSTQDYERPEDILRDADTAMYRAKANGKARHEVFDSQMHTRAVEALTLENDLRRALERGEIQPYFQPIMAMDTDKISGFEALARWVHPVRGIVSPADFIPLAEETGLIAQLGFSILKQACQQAVQWQNKFSLPELSISINLSGNQFRQAKLISEIETVLSETKLNPNLLILEITETIVMENTTTTVKMIKELKKIGVQISLDDFGTGYSSLSYLHRFPFDFIKIDRSFINRMTADKESLGIVKTILALASELEKIVVSEGVETKEQQNMLLQLECEYGQGFLFSKPLDSHSATNFLKSKATLSKENFNSLLQSSAAIQVNEVLYEM